MFLTDYYRFIPLCRGNGFLNWFFSLIEGWGWSEGVPFVGNYVPVVVCVYEIL